MICIACVRNRFPFHFFPTVSGCHFWFSIHRRWSLYVGCQRHRSIRMWENWIQDSVPHSLHSACHSCIFSDKNLEIQGRLRLVHSSWVFILENKLVMHPSIPQNGTRCDHDRKRKQSLQLYSRSRFFFIIAGRRSLVTRIALRIFVS